MLTAVLCRISFQVLDYFTLQEMQVFHETLRALIKISSTFPPSVYQTRKFCFHLASFNKGEDVNRTLDGGRKPLHYAADCGQLEILEFLLLKGADINVCKEHCHSRKKFPVVCFNCFI